MPLAWEIEFLELPFSISIEWIILKSDLFIS